MCFCFRSCSCPSCSQTTACDVSCKVVAAIKATYACCWFYTVHTHYSGRCAFAVVERRSCSQRHCCLRVLAIKFVATTSNPGDLCLHVKCSCLVLHYQCRCAVLSHLFNVGRVSNMTCFLCVAIKTWLRHTHVPGGVDSFAQLKIVTHLSCIESQLLVASGTTLMDKRSSVALISYGLSCSWLVY